ncbi:MAG: RNA polymerase sigma factor [Ilumatobacteraceae bacterium]
MSESVDIVSIGRIFREEYGRSIATLIRTFGDIDIAEEAVQEAFVEAAKRWPKSGLPPNPGAWITTTARNRAIDRIRRESTRHDRYVAAARLDPGDEPPVPVGPVNDDRLRLIFTCCHPALATATQVALTLRLLGGLETGEIAQAFLVSESTIAQRIVRAKAKITANNIPYRIPSDHELLDRLKPVLIVIYLIFNEGYTATGGTDLVRDDLCTEAIRLGRLLGQLMPDEPEAAGLLALMLLTASRRPARVDAAGEIVLLADQDRSLWDRALIDEGQSIVRASLRRNQPGPYQIQAAINAVHSDAPSAAETEWGQVLALYDMLIRIDANPVVALNRAVALAELDGADVALAAVDVLGLDVYHVFHATRAELLMRLGRAADAAAAFERALALTANEPERRFYATAIARAVTRDRR